MHPGIDAVPALVQELYALVRTLEAHFPGRKFTPDGHLVGSLGEVLAAYHYGLELYPASTEGHDGCCPEGRRVQVKATQRSQVGLSCEPEHLLVLKLWEDGTVTEVYNGPGSLAWGRAGPMQKNGHRPITLSRLRALMAEIPELQRMKEAVPQAPAFSRTTAGSTART